MIHAITPRDKDGKQTIVIGVVPANIRLMRAGQPLYVECDELGLPGLRIIITVGQTERAIVGELRAAGIEFPDGTNQGLIDFEREDREKGSGTDKIDAIDASIQHAAAFLLVLLTTHADALPDPVEASARAHLDGLVSALAMLRGGPLQ